MSIANIFFCSHIVSRLILGSGLLLFAISNISFGVAMVLMAAAAMIMRSLDGNWMTTLRLLRLLRWFVIPILLLHVLFTPGQLLWPGLPVSVSREGLMLGLWLSVRLATIYAMAMLMFRLLRQSEWLGLLIRAPKFGEQLMVRALVLMSMKKHMTERLLHLRQQFNLRHDWKKMPLLLMTVFRQTLTDASSYAQMLWLRWPQQVSMLIPVSSAYKAPTKQRYFFSVLWAACGCTGLVTPWLM